MIGDNIKKLREGYNLNKAELGRRLGIDRSTVTLYEQDKRTPSLEVLNKLAQKNIVGIFDKM